MSLPELRARFKDLASNRVENERGNNPPDGNNTHEHAPTLTKTLQRFATEGVIITAFLLIKKGLKELAGYLRMQDTWSVQAMLWIAEVAAVVIFAMVAVAELSLTAVWLYRTVTGFARRED